MYCNHRRREKLHEQFITTNSTDYNCTRNSSCFLYLNAFYQVVNFLTSHLKTLHGAQNIYSSTYSARMCCNHCEDNYTFLPGVGEMIATLAIIIAEIATFNAMVTHRGHRYVSISAKIAKRSKNLRLPTVLANWWSLDEVQ